MEKLNSEARRTQKSVKRLTFMPNVNLILFLQAPIALILVSLKWWENFVDKTGWTSRLFELKKEIQRVRIKMASVTSLSNIFVIIILLYFLEYLQVINN